MSVELAELEGVDRVRAWLASRIWPTSAASAAAPAAPVEQGRARGQTYADAAAVAVVREAIDLASAGHDPVTAAVSWWGSHDGAAGDPRACLPAVLTWDRGLRVCHLRTGPYLSTVEVLAPGPEGGCCAPERVDATELERLTLGRGVEPGEVEAVEVRSARGGLFLRAAVGSTYDAERVAGWLGRCAEQW